jgi:hypothetical protein
MEIVLNKPSRIFFSLIQFNLKKHSVQIQFQKRTKCFPFLSNFIILKTLHRRVEDLVKRGGQIRPSKIPVFRDQRDRCEKITRIAVCLKVLNTNLINHAILPKMK